VKTGLADAGACGKALPVSRAHLGPILGLIALLAAPPGASAEGVSGCPRTPVQPLAVPGLHAAFAAGRPVTIVALGSSSTAGAGAASPAAAYPARLQALLRAALPGAPLRVVNRGIGGQDAADMVARIEWDVTVERPDLVIWQVGANGALRRADPDRFRTLVAAGIARLRAAGAEVVLMDNQRAPRIEAAPGHERFDTTLAELAREHRVSLFSRRRLMGDWAERGAAPAAMLTGDGLHHNERGYACLAASLAEALLAGQHWAGR
jgi:lysophospholipase L1-like esterase